MCCECPDSVNQADCPGSEDFKTFFMVNSTEHEIFMLINLKLLTTANSFLLNLDEHVNFSVNKYKNANYCWHFPIYWQRKFNAQLS